MDSAAASSAAQRSATTVNNHALLRGTTVGNTRLYLKKSVCRREEFLTDGCHFTSRRA
jgi:hypothetical protein